MIFNLKILSRLLRSEQAALKDVVQNSDENSTEERLKKNIVVFRLLLAKKKNRSSLG